MLLSVNLHLTCYYDAIFIILRLLVGELFITWLIRRDVDGWSSKSVNVLTGQSVVAAVNWMANVISFLCVFSLFVRVPRFAVFFSAVVFEDQATVTEEDYPDGRKDDTLSFFLSFSLSLFLFLSLLLSSSSSSSSIFFFFYSLSRIQDY